MQQFKNKPSIIRHFDNIAAKRPHWYARNHLYHDQVASICRGFIRPESRVLELGCSTGQLLGTLNPGFGVGIDISPQSINIAREQYPHLNWLCYDVESRPEDKLLSQPFDIIIVEDLLGYLDDIQRFFELLHDWTNPETRLIVSNWNWLWKPILYLVERLGLKAPDSGIRQNWISSGAVKLFLDLANYEILDIQPRLLLPYAIGGLSSFVNRFSASPILKRFTFLTALVARPKKQPALTPYSVSIVIPTRNEAANIQSLVKRLPMMGKYTETIFVDGSSTDGTIEEIQRAIQENPGRTIRFLNQVEAPLPYTAPNKMLKLGKGDAVRKGFRAATGDILMILDSDLSVAPEDLPKFYQVLVSGKARFANGTRFIYAQENGAMRLFNRLGNIAFSAVFRWLLGYWITDTLCGTKVLFKLDYEQIVDNREQFGDFDPFGDFELLFGIARLNHSVIDVPVHYWARQYGESKVRVKTHGPLLIHMSLLALWYFKIRPLLRRNRLSRMLFPRIRVPEE